MPQAVPAYKHIAGLRQARVAHPLTQEAILEEGGLLKGSPIQITILITHHSIVGHMSVI